MNQPASRTHATASGAVVGARSMTGFDLLFLTCLAKAVIPGAVNFIQQPHPLPGLGLTYEFTPLAGQVSSGLSLMLVAVCLALIARKKRLLVPPATWLLIAFAVITQDVTSGLKSSGALALLQVILVAVTISSLRPTRAELRIVGLGAAAIAVYSLIFAMAMPLNAQFLIGGSGAEGTKAFVGEYVLAGPVTHSNTLGIAIALGMPFLGLVEGKWVRRALWLVCAVTVLLSASRTAMIALAGWAAFRLLEVLVRDFRVRAFRGAVLLVAVGLAAFLPISLSDRSGLSTRVGLWQDSLAAWQESGEFLLGIGAQWGADGIANAIAPTSSAHNLLVQLLVSGGLLLLFVGALVLFLAAKSAVAADRFRQRPVLTAYVCVLFVISSTEYVLPWTVSSQLFPVTGFVLAALLALQRPASAQLPERD